MLTNNDILKKLRVAHKLRDENIVEILKLVDFEITKGALGDLFRAEDHPKYVDAGDQILRKFLDGLIIHLRGERPPKVKAKEAVITLEKPK
ncbi:DUF1456 family protein [Roseivirga sp.]|uniref:DUF1456 family protein n=1 Tax=Roseivirga sp. TaxID=1964215 RepID=UPI002B267995|nr:DUF1456 family protein [Roseivirga sp.]